MLRNGLLAGAFTILAVVAAVGWTRKNAQPTPVNPAAYATYAQPVSATYAQPASSQASYYDANGSPVYANAANPCVDNNGVAYQTGAYRRDDGYVQSVHRPVVVRYASALAPVPVQERTTYYREVRHRRSGKKSAAIVAGSAGVGAAIGALAGGGKGAGIGALAGGAGGFIYDRLTHNR